MLLPSTATITLRIASPDRTGNPKEVASVIHPALLTPGLCLNEPWCCLPLINSTDARARSESKTGDLFSGSSRFAISIRTSANDSNRQRTISARFVSINNEPSRVTSGTRTCDTRPTHPKSIDKMMMSMPVFIVVPADSEENSNGFQPRSRSHASQKLPPVHSPNMCTRSSGS